MSIPAAATLHDEIKHSGLGANILKVATTFGVGLLTGMAIGAAAVFVVGTGGLGALVLGAVVGAVFGAVADGVAQSITGKGLDESLTAPIHAAIDKVLPGVVKGLIVTGSPDVRVNSKAAARAQADEVLCSDHPSVPRPRIAQGSGNVFINSHPAARVGDKTECGAVLSVNPGRKGNVGIGGGQVTVLEIGDGLPPWLSAVSRYLGYALAVCQAIRGRGKLAQKIICFGGNALMGMAADKLVSTTGLSQAVADRLNGLKGHPVHVPSGAKVLNGEHDTDFEMPAAMPLAWVRHYNSLTPRSSGLFGQGWSTLYDMELRLNDADRSDLPSGPRPPDTPHTLIDPAGRAIPIPALAEQQKFALPQEGMTLACLEGGSHGRYVLQLADGWVADFGSPGGGPDQPETLRPLFLQDPNENAHHLAYGEQGQLLAVRTTCGQELRLLYELGQHPQRVTRIDYCNGSLVQGAACPVQTLVHYGYDANGQLNLVRNAVGEETRRFAYDAAGRMTFQRLPEGLEVHYDWVQVAASGPTGWRVSGWRTSLGERVHIQYQLQGQAPSAVATTYLPNPDAAPGDTAAAQPASQETWHWDAQHRVTRYTDALGQSWRLQWDGDKRQLAGLTSPLDTTVSLAYDEHGHLSRLTDPLGRVTHTRWHPEWALPLAVQHPDQSRTVYQYDSQGNLCVQEAWGPPPQDPAQPAPRPLTTERWAYDTRGHLIAHTDAKGGQQLFAHSPRGLLLRHTDCSQRQTRYGYDPHSPWGALQSVTQADGSRHTFQTDALARPTAHTRPDHSTVRWQWNARGQLAAQADALGHISRCHYNELGQCTRIADPLGQTIRQDHSAQGLLLQLTDAAGQTTRFIHDAAGQLITQQAIDGIRTDYRLDALGLPVVVQTRSADGTLTQRIELQRDAAGRLTQKLTAHTRTVYHYSALDQLLQIDRFERLPDWGSEPQGERPLDTLAFAYDALGHLAEEVSTQFDYPAAAPGEPPVKTPRHQRHSVVRHSHDELGNTLQTVLPQGQRLNYLYYGSGHLHHIHLDGHTISDFERDALHQETLRTQGQLRTHKTRDAMGRVLHQVSRLGEVGFEDLRHQDLWHQAGQQRSIHRQPNHLIKAYAFDANAEFIWRRDPARAVRCRSCSVCAAVVGAAARGTWGPRHARPPALSAALRAGPPRRTRNAARCTPRRSRPASIAWRRPAFAPGRTTTSRRR